MIESPTPQLGQEFFKLFFFKRLLSAIFLLIKFKNEQPCTDTTILVVPSQVSSLSTFFEIFANFTTLFNCVLVKIFNLTIQVI